MIFPLKRIWRFDSWIPLTQTTMRFGFGFGLEYPQSLQDAYGFKFHDGHDWPVPIGEPIYAIDDGTILGTTDSPIWGKGVWQRLSNGTLVCYWHLNEISVTQGSPIKEGDVIGLSGNTGKSGGPHLHFGIRKNGIDIDPLTIFKDEGTDMVTKELLDKIYKLAFNRGADSAALGYVGHEAEFVIDELLKSMEVEDRNNEICAAKAFLKTYNGK